MCNRSAIHFTVTVVSARNRTASATFCRVALGASCQLGLPPSPPLQFRRDDPFRLRLRRLLPLRSVMLGSHPLLHLRQQLLPKRVPPPDTSPAASAWKSAPASAPRRSSIACSNCRRPAGTVLGNAVFAQQPLHPQPRPDVCAGAFKILRPTAPPINAAAAASGAQQLRPHRIQMHVIAHRLEVAACRCHPRSAPCSAR